MALIFTDPNTAGPFPTFGIKDVVVKVVKLTYANFSTAGVNTLVAALPADASILSIAYWNKTKLAGNSISAATISIGASSGGTDFVNGFDILSPASGARAAISPITGILQPYNIPLGLDIQLFVNGTATTGNPTSGEIYLIIEYVR